MKARFIYEDGKELIFRHYSDRETVRMADSKVPEHGMVQRIIEEEKVKGFGLCDSRNTLLLRNGLVGAVEKTDKGYEFNLYESEYLHGIYEPTRFYSGGVIDDSDIVNGSVLCTLDRLYGKFGTDFDVFKGRDNIIIDEESAFATVFSDKIDFKFNVELGALKCDEIESLYGEMNSCLVHVLIDKDRNLSIEAELYMKDLTVISMDSETTINELFTNVQLEKIRNYTKLFFIGRETEFDLSDSRNEDLESWTFDKAYMDSYGVGDIKDAWIDEDGNEFIIAEITEDGETYGYAKVVSMDLKDTRLFELGFLEMDRESVMERYTSEVADYFISQAEAGKYVDEGPKVDKVRVLAERLDKFALNFDPYEYMDNFNLSEGENAVDSIYNDLTNGKLSGYMEWFENGVLDEDTEDLEEAKALYGELKTLEESFINARKLGAKR